MNPSVAEYIVSALAQAGVQRVYGIVGDSLNGITEAVRRNPDVDWVSVRHGWIANARSRKMLGVIVLLLSGPVARTSTPFSLGEMSDH